MNILICTPNNLNVPCAALNRLGELRKALHQFDCKVYLSGAGSTSKRYKIVDNNVICNMPIRRKFLPPALKVNANSALFYKQNIKDIINDLEIDIVIIYSMFSTFIEPIALACKQLKISCVTDGGERYSITLRNLLNGVNYMQFRAIFYSLKLVDGLIVCSPRWQKYATSIQKPSVLFPSIVPSGLKAKSGAIKAKKKNSFRVVFIGALTYREMPEKLVTAFQIARKRGLEIELVIIGRQSNYFVDKLSFGKLFKIISREENITLTGFIDIEEKEAWLRSADCFVLMRPPCKETYHLFPTRLPEYFTLDKPVILTNTEPFNLFYSHKKEVFFIPESNNSKDLAEAFIYLASNPEVATYIGMCGKEYANKNYSHQYLGNLISHFLKKIKNA